MAWVQVCLTSQLYRCNNCNKVINSPSPISLHPFLIFKMPLLWPLETELNKVLQEKGIAFIMKFRFLRLEQQVRADLARVCLRGCQSYCIPRRLHLPGTYWAFCVLYMFASALPSTFNIHSSILFFFYPTFTSPLWPGDPCVFLNTILPNPFLGGWSITTAGNSVLKVSDLRRVSTRVITKV